MQPHQVHCSPWSCSVNSQKRRTITIATSESSQNQEGHTRQKEQLHTQEQELAVASHTHRDIPTCDHADTVHSSSRFLPLHPILHLTLHYPSLLHHQNPPYSPFTPPSLLTPHQNPFTPLPNTTLTPLLHPISFLPSQWIATTTNNPLSVHSKHTHTQNQLIQRGGGSPQKDASAKQPITITANLWNWRWNVLKQLLWLNVLPVTHK